jgi:NodT family efflux transporter outer membrane factor (OMF) lipoprotein
LGAVLAAGWAAALVAAAGCAVGPDYAQPRPDVPDAWHVALTRGLEQGEASFQTWWTTLDDPVLTSLIERATRDSLDIRGAVARIEEAAARRGVSVGELFPAVDGTGEYSRNRTSTNESAGVPPPRSRVDGLYSAGLSSSWEVDLFGRIRRSVESASADLDAAVEDLRDTLVVLYANIGLTYAELRTLQERIRYNQQNVRTQRETLGVVQSRYKAGLVGDLDVRWAEENLASTEAALPPLRQQLVQAINRLGVLLGLPPTALHAELAAEAPITQPPAQVAVRLPRELLRQRPDIRTAERQLAAQTAQIGVATADLYPRLSLLGSFNLSSFDSSDWSDSDSRGYSFGPSFTWALFSGGAIRANIRVQEALTEQALTSYEQTILDALEDVEGSLVAFVQEQDRRDALDRSTRALNQALDLVKTQYRRGLTDFQNVLDTERSLFTRQDDLATSRGQVTQNLINVYRALGGGWTP